MDLVSELQALQFLKPLRKAKAEPTLARGMPRQALPRPAQVNVEMPPRRSPICPDAARRLRIRALAAGAFA